MIRTTIRFHRCKKINYHWHSAFQLSSLPGIHNPAPLSIGVVVYFCYGCLCTFFQNSPRRTRKWTMVGHTSTTNYWILNTILKPKTFPTNRECSKQDQKMALHNSLKERFFVMLADLSLDQIFSETVQCFHKWRRIEASPKKRVAKMFTGLQILNW